jgi:hypothetical protein
MQIWVKQTPAAQKDINANNTPATHSIKRRKDARETKVYHLKRHGSMTDTQSAKNGVEMNSQWNAMIDPIQNGNGTQWIWRYKHVGPEKYMGQNAELHEGLTKPTKTCLLSKQRDRCVKGKKKGIST